MGVGGMSSLNWNWSWCRGCHVGSGHWDTLQGLDKGIEGLVLDSLLLFVSFELGLEDGVVGLQLSDSGFEASGDDGGGSDWSSSNTDSDVSSWKGGGLSSGGGLDDSKFKSDLFVLIESL